jgi:hypothetical protein
VLDVVWKRRRDEASVGTIVLPRRAPTGGEA